MEDLISDFAHFHSVASMDSGKNALKINSASLLPLFLSRLIHNQLICQNFLKINSDWARVLIFTNWISTSYSYV